MKNTWSVWERRNLICSSKRREKMGACGSKPRGCGMGFRRKFRARRRITKTPSLSNKLNKVDPSPVSSVSIDRSFCNPTYQGIILFYFFVTFRWNVLWVVLNFRIRCFSFTNLLVIDCCLFCEFTDFSCLECHERLKIC